MMYKCVIFDFAGTLCSEPYFKPLRKESFDAISLLIFGENSEEWADPWMSGDITSREIAEYLSQSIPESSDEIVSALQEGCSKMSFNPAVYEFALSLQNLGIKTGLVTPIQ